MPKYSTKKRERNDYRGCLFVEVEKVGLEMGNVFFHVRTLRATCKVVSKRYAGFDLVLKNVLPMIQPRSLRYLH